MERDLFTLMQEMHQAGHMPSTQVPLAEQIPTADSGGVAVRPSVGRGGFCAAPLRRTDWSACCCMGRLGLGRRPWPG